MGIDLSGWVEVRQPYQGITPPPPEKWQGVIKADNVADRSYDMFGCLFGVGNYANFIPVVELRGLPDTISDEAGDDFLRWETFAQSWITWREIKEIDWDQDAVDGKPHRYERAEDGKLVIRDKSVPNPVDKAAGHSGDVEGDTWERGGFVYKVERISRREVLDSRPDWQLLFDLMARLAAEYGDDGVRLVVWFDQ